MATPLSRRRLPRQVATSKTTLSRTPKTSCRTVPILPTTPSSELLGRSTTLKFDDDDDDDRIMPCTQVFNTKNEVFWNFEASPRTRLTLAFDNGGSGDEDDVSLKPKQAPKNSTPIVKLKTKQVKKPSLNDLYADKDFILMKELSDQIVAEEKDSRSNSIQVTSPPAVVVSQSPGFNQSNDDPFANDDSFLVMCSQAIETKASDHNANTKQKVRKPQSVQRAMPVPPKFELSPEKAFDDDDSEEFEFLLSQIDIPTGGVPNKPVSKANIDPVKKLSESRAPDTICPSDEKTRSGVLFKRFKSTDDTPKLSTAPSDTRTKIVKSFRRNNSSPNAASTNLPGGRVIVSDLPQCSKLEIERKRQEAIKRRIMNSQKPRKV